MKKPAVAFVLALLAAPIAKDPRIELVQLQMDLDPATALHRLDQHSETATESFNALGLSYLKGVLLDSGGHDSAAQKAFADVLAHTPELAPWARYRLALAQEASGHPAVAAGMVATLLGSGPPQPLVEPAVELLHRSLETAGDCRVLNGLSSARLKGLDRRRMLLTRAACARRADNHEQEKVLLADILAEDSTDDPASLAAERLSTLIDPKSTDARTLVDLGMAFYHHRRFDRSIELLTLALSSLDAASTTSTGAANNLRLSMTNSQAFDSRYALARSFFWLGRYHEAASIFGTAAAAVAKKKLKAKALYQQARCFELAGAIVDPEPHIQNPSPATVKAWTQAVDFFEKVWATDPTSGWASAALIGRVRLQWLLGHTEPALQTLRLLSKKGRADNQARALLFLAVSDLVLGKTTAATHLAAAQKIGRLPKQEIGYWQGRLAELEGRPEDAVDAYLIVLAEDPFHPFGEAARSRLTAPALRDQALETATWLAAGPDVQALHKAWLLLGDNDPRGVAARRAISSKLTADPRTAAFMDMSLLPAAQWPLWSKDLGTPEELFLALGLFGEAPTPVLRHFPISDPSLAFTGSTILARNGATRRSLYIAEILLKRVPDPLPKDLLSTAYQELLYPFRFSYLIMREASKRGIDPFLLAGLIREESRFDADAFSGASARGLTQFVYPTALEIAESIELAPISPRDIHRPEIAIALGAAYLRRLADNFDGNLEAMVAAYNAGEPQSLLWKRYCFSQEAEEYWSKVAFRETRSYVRKVLTSRSHYRDLYGKVDNEHLPPVPEASPTTPQPAASDASGAAVEIW